MRADYGYGVAVLSSMPRVPENYLAGISTFICSPVVLLEGIFLENKSTLFLGSKKQSSRYLVSPFLSLLTTCEKLYAYHLDGHDDDGMQNYHLTASASDADKQSGRLLGERSNGR